MVACWFSWKFYAFWTYSFPFCFWYYPWWLILVGAVIAWEIFCSFHLRMIMTLFTQFKLTNVVIWDKKSSFYHILSDTSIFKQYLLNINFQQRTLSLFDQHICSAPNDQLNTILSPKLIKIQEKISLHKTVGNWIEIK